MGEQAADGGPGTPVASHPYPRGTSPQDVAPPASDDFASPWLGPQWHWQANPRHSWSVPARRRPADPPAAGQRSGQPPGTAQRPGARSFLARRPPSPPRWNCRTSRWEPAPAWWCWGRKYAWLGIVRTADGFVLGAGPGGGAAEQNPWAGPSTPGPRLELQIRTDGTPRSTFAWRGGPGEPWEVQGWNFSVVQGKWIGAELGIFATSPLGSARRRQCYRGTRARGHCARSPGLLPRSSPFRHHMTPRTAPLTATPRPKIADVAAAAGVSVPTVSKVLNGRTHVSDATRAKVQQALADLDYSKRNAAAAQPGHAAAGGQQLRFALGPGHHGRRGGRRGPAGLCGGVFRAEHVTADRWRKLREPSANRLDGVMLLAPRRAHAW